MDERRQPRLAAQMADDGDEPIPLVSNRPPDADEIPPCHGALVGWLRSSENVLSGTVYGHPRHRNGTHLTKTAPVTHMWRDGDRLMALTALTLFQLTDPYGEPWFSEAAVRKRGALA